MTQHNDELSPLNQKQSLSQNLLATHKTLKKQFPFIARIAIALYDEHTHRLKTYVHSSGEDNPLPHYEANLNESVSLKSLLEKATPRVINNLLTFETGTAEHSQRIGRQGYAASYTLPIFNEGNFIGFIFFNSYDKDVFTEDVLSQIDIYAHMITLMLINELCAIKMLSAAIKTTGQITHVRDPETGSHLDRMSRYSRLIAMKIADAHDLDDEYIEHIFMFSPLHDIGKLGIPDNILLKPDNLTDDEMAIMRTHAEKGSELIDTLLSNFGLTNIKYSNMLRNITRYHHEYINGEGYPSGKKGNHIPLEARIVAVADVFDALTSDRPYKKAWTNDEAISKLKELSGITLDAECVSALLSNMQRVEEIQQLFKENLYI